MEIRKPAYLYSEVFEDLKSSAINKLKQSVVFGYTPFTFGFKYLFKHLMILITTKI